ncbi:carboxylesterase family protein [Bisporella sp. PMI_857]|nr:carboxylesterase family protein [Bisporella sp. PMI_857]
MLTEIGKFTRWSKVVTLSTILMPIACATELEIKTTSGLVRGFYNNTAETVRTFLGMPFAEPPVGKLRWAPPVDKRRSDSILNATSFGMICPQSTSDSESIYAVLPYRPWGDVISEDCLTINIWAPSSKNHALLATSQSAAVMMFVHGGAFSEGGSTVAYYDGTNIVQDNDNIIVVTFNYRLGVFGFPNAPGLRDGEQNVGLLDQRLALEWVYRNIAQFGGDPHRITLFGQSAGAASTDIYTYAYYDDPIIHAAIMESGTASLLTTNDSNHENWNALSNALRCSSLDSYTNMECMRKLPFQSILNKTAAGLYLFVPVQDNQTVFSNYTERANRGKIARIPSLIGSNERETATNFALNSTSVNETIVAVGTQRVFQCPAALSSLLRAQNNIPIWRYLYHGNWSNVSPAPFLGAYHSSEIPIIFGTYYKAGPPATPQEIEASKYIQGAWVSFAQDPQSLSAKYRWPDYYTQDSTIVNLALNNATIANLTPAAKWDTYCNPL